MEIIGPILLLLAGFALWVLAFALHERKVERLLRQQGAQRRLQGWVAMNERSRQAKPDGL